MVNKPKGWSLAKRSSCAEASLEAYMSTIVADASKLYFPFELDSRISGLSVVCTDRGMQSQFERFRVKNDIEYTYRLILGDPKVLESVLSDDISVHNCGEVPNGIDVDVCSQVFCTVAKLQHLFDNLVISDSINLHALKFPDPVHPHVQEISVSIPRVPFGSI